MKHSELIELAKKKLMENNISDYNSDAFLLLEYVFGLSKTDYFMKMNENIASEEKIAEYTKCLEMRISGKPLQYITGTQDFMGLTFKVNEAVLIPRYDTEILVEKVLQKLKAYGKKASDVSVCDMCTGSGCIGISIARLSDVKDVICVDISKDALEVAKENASENAVEHIRFVESDLFVAFDEVKDNLCNLNECASQKLEMFDFIVSNPPYIKTEEIDNLMNEVKLHEPMLALDGDADGLKFYNIITKEASARLYEGGWLMYEIGYDQGEDVSNLMKENGFADVEVFKDLAGLDRVVIGRKN